MTALDQAGERRVGRLPVSVVRFAGLTVAATGGPLALVALYVPGLLGDASGSAGRVALLGAALFVPALVVWLRYSAEITTAGGLSGFVEAAAGRRVALVQAGLWLVSYLLYLVYTVTFIAYDLLPAMFPALDGPVRPLVQVLVAVIIAAVTLLPVQRCLTVVATAAAAQLALVGGLAVVAAHTVNGSPTAPPVRTGTLLVASGNTALLFICASLPLFLAGEVHGGNAAVRRGLSVGWLAVAAGTVVAMAPFAGAGPAVLDSPVPGFTVAQRAGMPGLATAVGVGVAASVAGVVTAELLALSRLLHAVTRVSVARTIRVLAAVLVVGSTVSLLNPQRVYNDLLKPSLVALWLAQLLVFAVYPRFAAKRRGRRLADLALAGGGCALMLFGLWSTTVNQLGT